MTSSSKNQQETSQEPLIEVDRFVVFRVSHSLGKGIKRRIKSFGCGWNVLHKGWLCPLAKQEEVQKTFLEAGLQAEMQPVSMPKGMIPADPKLASRQTRLEILEEQLHRNDELLFRDVYRYNDSLRPSDFSEPPCEEEQSPEKIRIERDFHDRWLSLKKMKEDIDQARKELSHLETDPGEKVFDPGAPLLISDDLIAKHFLWKEHRTLHYCSDMFWQWDGVKYVELCEEAMRQKVYSFLRDAKELTEAGLLENFNPTKYKVDQIIDALRATCHHTHHPASGAIWLDGRNDPDPKYLISFSNGLLNVSDWLESHSLSLMPHTPLFMNVNSLPFALDPDAGKPLEWLRFLDSIWLDDVTSQETLQEWIGYSLVRDTRFHKILLMVGPLRSGKGTIGRCLLELLGSFNVIGPTLSSLGGEFGLQPFLNKMLALISDVRMNERSGNNVIIERLLSISGEDPLSINRKYLPALTVQLPTRIVMLSNELPNMKDASGALAKRYIILTTTKSWYGKEDTSLFSRLCLEMPAIFLWALEGLSRLLSRGRFLQPESSVQMIEELEAMTSPVKTFVAENCVLSPHATISPEELFKAWRSWCSEAGFSNQGNIQSFGKKFRAAFPHIEVIRPQDDLFKRKRYYKGIALESPSCPSADVRGSPGGTDLFR